MKHLPDSIQNLISPQFCIFTYVKYHTHPPIRHQTTEHWNPVTHTYHLGSTSGAGSKNTLTSATRKYSQPWNSSNMALKLQLRLISVKNTLETSLLDSPDTGGVCVLTEHWGCFDRRHSSSVDRAHWHVVHTHAPAPEARKCSLHIISGILVLMRVGLHPSS